MRYLGFAFKIRAFSGNSYKKIIFTKFFSIKFIKSFILITLIMHTASCSNTRIIYSLAEKFVEDEVTFFIDLDKEEEIRLTKQVTELVEWHRKNMLPKYETYLRDTAEKLAKNQYSYVDIKNILIYGRALIEETVIGLTPFTSKFLVEHQTVGDIDFLEKQMEKRRQQRLENLSKPSNKLYEIRKDRLIKNFERFFGNLNDSQVILIKRYASETLDDKRVRLNNRTMRQKAFLEFLRTQPNQKSLMIYTNKLLLSGHEITNQGYRDFQDSSLVLFSELMSNMLEVSSDMQRERVIKKIRKYANDFKVFSG